MTLETNTKSDFEIFESFIKSDLHHNEVMTASEMCKYTGLNYEAVQKFVLDQIKIKRLVVVFKNTEGDGKWHGLIPPEQRDPKKILVGFLKF